MKLGKSLFWLYLVWLFFLIEREKKKLFTERKKTLVFGWEARSLAHQCTAVETNPFHTYCTSLCDAKMEEVLDRLEGKRQSMVRKK